MIYNKKAPNNCEPYLNYSMVRYLGAGNGAQTRDLHLGKVALYQLSYSRVCLEYKYDTRIILKSQYLFSIKFHFL